MYLDRDPRSMILNLCNLWNLRQEKANEKVQEDSHTSSLWFLSNREAEAITSVTIVIVGTVLLEPDDYKLRLKVQIKVRF